MQQTLKVSIAIPETHVMLTLDEFKEYKKLELKGKYFTLNQLAKRINRSEEWIKKHVIDNPRNRRQIESFSKFSTGKGTGYMFHAEKILDWLDNHFEDVVKG
ncbi:DUF771 domain-containing protein [Staphylococcus ratti]|uniref:DUF771 domain-containing protein n=1 Tax=Staphylococcus ratti TaxID=2892440 RepID=A0ABY3PBN4_9STAP|nr:DUF771 domain-containing protein [Staphylococcus ratti]UEX89720.1 DUF771 domain-containing protein [Staphylococcus ratti]